MTERLLRDQRFSNNWYINQLVWDKLVQHDLDKDHSGPDGARRIYIGDSRSLPVIHKTFAAIVQEYLDAQKKLTVRRSCVDAVSSRYHITSLYLSVRNSPTDASIYQATWTPPISLQEAQIASDVIDQFGDLMGYNFTPSTPVFKGVLHQAQIAA